MPGLRPIQSMTSRDGMYWIKLKDQLPDPDDRVLCFIPANTSPYNIFLLQYVVEQFPEGGLAMFFRGPERIWATSWVTHWMPLPLDPDEEC